MINQIIDAATHLIITVINSTGYAGVFFLMSAESALIPIPSEVTMPFAGFLAFSGTFNVAAVILVGAIANLFGSILAYFIGYFGEDLLIRNLVHKYGKFLLISISEYEKSEKWFRTYGEKIVLFSRILPIVRTFISLPAGVAKMDFKKFVLFTFIGSLIWSTVLTLVGYTLGANWHSIEGYYRKFEDVIIVLIIALAAYYIYHKLRKLKK